MPKKPSKTLREWCIENKREDLLEEWDYEKNNELGYTPDNVSYGSAKDIWWKCKQNHTYPQKANTKTNIKTKNGSVGCPYCSGQKLLENYNDLETYCKQNDKEYLLDEFDYDKNFPITPKTIYCHSTETIWWKCKNNHSWQTKVYVRTRMGCNCPDCYGNRLLFGSNDFETWCKNNNRLDLLKEWDYNKNTILPSEITAHNDTEKIWWKCDKNHSWSTVVSVRTSGSNCPKCNDNKTSFPEQTIFYYVKQYFCDAIHRHKELGFELDIYIPSIKTAIEYDGHYFHKRNSNKKEIEKNQLAKQNDIKLIRIREKGLCPYDDCDCIYREDGYTNKSLKQSIEALFNKLNVKNFNINIENDTTKILEQYKVARLENSVAVKFPDIAKQWHPTKNGGLKPDQFNYGCDDKVWWICEKGHEWQAIISSRTKKNGNNCPYCSGQMVWKGDNDFETYCKDHKLTHLLEEWDYNKNAKKPNEYTWCSGQKVWWKCKNNHSYSAPISRRIGGTNCEKCIGRKKKVKCIETNEVFESGADAAKFCGLSRGDCIYQCCRGKRKTAGGYHWEYVDKENNQEKEEK